MTKDPASTFDEVATLFADYGASVPGFIRYKLTQRNLQRYLSKKSINILDIGGGSGPDAGWLAEQGHKVTLIEPSEKQREYAQRRFNFFLEDDARKNVTIIPSVLQKAKLTAPFDLVLLHGVAMYQANPAECITDALSHVKKGGLVSIVEKGYYGAEARAVCAKDFIGLEALQSTQRSKNHMGEEVYAFKPEEITGLLEKHGMEILEWSGIRVISDQIREEASNFTHAELEQILSAEYDQGHNQAIRGHGQLLQFIARKN